VSAPLISVALLLFLQLTIPPVSVFAVSSSSGSYRGYVMIGNTACLEDKPHLLNCRYAGRR